VKQTTIIFSMFLPTLIPIYLLFLRHPGTMNQPCFFQSSYIQIIHIFLLLL